MSLLDADLSDMKDSSEPYDYKFVKWMTKNKKLSAIPVSAFCNAEVKSQFEKFVRFCFIKKTLHWMLLKKSSRHGVVRSLNTCR